MTEQEYKAKQNELKQVRQNISDLGKRENELRREIAQYDANEYLSKYYYEPDMKAWLKPIAIRGEKIAFISVSDYKDEDMYFTECFVEHDYYSLDFMSKLQEVPKGRFVENVNKILKEARKTIFGDDK